MNTPVDQVGLAPYWLLCAIASGVMMLADYGLTLWAAQPALRAGAVYELNPWWLAVTNQRWFYGPRSMAAALGVVMSDDRQHGARPWKMPSSFMPSAAASS